MITLNRKYKCNIFIFVGGGGVTVWAGVCHVQPTQVHFIDGFWNAQRYPEEIRRLIVMMLCISVYDSFPVPANIQQLIIKPPTILWNHVLLLPIYCIYYILQV